jgi:hypothetical protein
LFDQAGKQQIRDEQKKPEKPNHKKKSIKILKKPTGLVSVL